MGERNVETTSAIKTRDGAPPLLMPGLLHEWFADGSPFPPLMLAVCLAHQSVASRERGRAVFVGSRVFPYVRSLVRCRTLAEVIARAIFVDADRSDRAFVLDAVPRCAATSFLIADGSGIDMAFSRRLQLAAGAGGTLAISLRPLSELRELSAAATRWRVRSCPSDDDQPRWSLELLRCKGLRPTADARRWTVRVCHETGDVRVAPDAPDRCGEENGSPPEARAGFGDAARARDGPTRPRRTG